MAFEFRGCTLDLNLPCLTKARLLFIKLVTLTPWKFARELIKRANAKDACQ